MHHAIRALHTTHHQPVPFPHPRQGKDNESMASGKQTEGLRGERVGEWDRLVMGSKDGMYCMVYWVLYATNEASNFALESGDVLYGD